MNHRTQKQIIIALSTLILVSSLAWGVYIIWPSKIDLPKDELRDDVFKSENIEVIFNDFFEVRDRVYDALAYIKNPNQEYGASEIIYEFVFKSETGEGLRRVSGKTFVLPGEDRYIIESAVRIEGEPVNVSFSIKSATWEKLQPFSALGLTLRDTRLSRTENSSSFTGIVKNGTPFNLQDVEVQVALFGANEAVVSVGETNLQTLLRGSERSFRISWPYVLPPDLKIDARVGSNFLENSNFIREFGTPDKFQEYY